MILPLNAITHKEKIEYNSVTLHIKSPPISTSCVKNNYVKICSLCGKREQEITRNKECKESIEYLYLET